MPTSLKTRTEMRYGRPISDDEFEKASEYARMKLDFQNNLYHRNYGDDYLVILIAETVNQNRLSAYYDELRATQEGFLELAQERVKQEEQERVEKMAHDIGVPCAVVRELMKHLGYPYCTTLTKEMQYGGMKNVG